MSDFKHSIEIHKVIQRQINWNNEPSTNSIWNACGRKKKVLRNLLEISVSLLPNKIGGFGGPRTILGVWIMPTQVRHYPQKNQ